MSLVFVVCCAGSGLCDELIAGSEESHWMFVLNYVWSRNPNNETA